MTCSQDCPARAAMEILAAACARREDSNPFNTERRDVPTWILTSEVRTILAGAGA